MSRLTVYHDAAPDVAVLRTEDPGEMAAALAPLGVRFERWESPVALSPEDSPETILDAYRPYLDGLMGARGAGDGQMGASGAGSADVVKMSPQTPNIDAIRAKFLAEHTHSEDEIRFFVHGAGNFVLHVDGRVYDAYCTAGDLISVPAGTKHWFDAGTAPSFTALRVFTDTSGWVPHYTGDTISERFTA